MLEIRRSRANDVSPDLERQSPAAEYASVAVTAWFHLSNVPPVQMMESEMFHVKQLDVVVWIQATTVDTGRQSVSREASWEDLRSLGPISEIHSSPRTYLATATFHVKHCVA